jgi:hypothetical protein
MRHNPASMAEPKKTPLEPSFIQNVVSGVNYSVRGVDTGGWFSPGQPLTPVAQNEPGAKGRMWDFPVAINMRQQPRQEEAVSFAQLRATGSIQLSGSCASSSRREKIKCAAWSSPSSRATRRKSRTTAARQIEEFFRFA